MTTTPAYDALTATFTRQHHLGHLQAIAGWDQATFMPPKGNEARAAAMAELATLMHRFMTAPALQGEWHRAEREPLDDWQRANVREMRRVWRGANALPEALVQAQSLASARCEHAWRTQRPANDWAGFAANLREVVRLAREIATRLATDSGADSLYDALMDQYEPGMTCAEVDRVFGDLRQWLPGLIDDAIARQATEAVITPVGPFPVEAQRALCERVMRWLGFDFGAGRLDVSTHPFCGGVPEDVRLTTRYRDDDFLQSLMGTIHETGHARYEQGRPHAWITQPVSAARSMALHESQSLSFEMQLGCSPAFMQQLAPMIIDAFGPQPAFTPSNLARLTTRVKRSLIRVEADEVTYPTHIILRYDIERALIEGRAEVDDIPTLWATGMQSLLGLDTRGDFANGPMQDVHWASGAFGYFPCYTLGAMYAAQWFATLQRQHPDLPQQIEAGQLDVVTTWLQTHLWSQGSRWTTAQLCERATGEVLNPTYFRAHLMARYAPSQAQ